MLKKTLNIFSLCVALLFSSSFAQTADEQLEQMELNIENELFKITANRFANGRTTLAESELAQSLVSITRQLFLIQELPRIHENLAHQLSASVSKTFPHISPNLKSKRTQALVAEFVFAYINILRLIQTRAPFMSYPAIEKHAQVLWDLCERWGLRNERKTWGRTITNTFKQASWGDVEKQSYMNARTISVRLRLAAENTGKGYPATLWFDYDPQRSIQVPLPASNEQPMPDILARIENKVGIRLSIPVSETFQYWTSHRTFLQSCGDFVARRLNLAREQQAR
jgi:hypothetical protein